MVSIDGGPLQGCPPIQPVPLAVDSTARKATSRSPISCWPGSTECVPGKEELIEAERDKRPDRSGISDGDCSAWDISPAAADVFLVAGICCFGPHQLTRLFEILGCNVFASYLVVSPATEESLVRLLDISADLSNVVRLSFLARYGGCWDVRVEVGKKAAR